MNKTSSQLPQNGSAKGASRNQRHETQDRRRKSSTSDGAGPSSSQSRDSKERRRKKSSQEPEAGKSVASSGQSKSSPKGHRGSIDGDLDFTKNALPRGSRPQERRRSSISSNSGAVTRKRAEAKFEPLADPSCDQMHAVKYWHRLGKEMLAKNTTTKARKSPASAAPRSPTTASYRNRDKLHHPEKKHAKQTTPHDEKHSRRAKKDTAYIGMFKAKILIVGPCESGKSVIANFLSDATETSGGDYHPTQGVRILEFECNGIEVSAGRTANIEVELWDCSGDHKFSTCWPAFQKDTNGLVIVYNPDQVNHDKELETWYSKFVTAQGLRDSQCVVFAHHKPTSTDRTRSQLPPSLSRVACIQTNLDEEAETVREEFNNFLAKVISNWTDKRDQEELSIMNN